MKKIHEMKNLNVSDFPAHKLIPNPRINITPSSGNDSYDRNFTNRGKKSLLIIQKEINKLPDTVEKEFMQFVLVCTLVLTRITQYGSSSNYLYRVIKTKAQESNAWIQFKRKFDFMIKFKFENKLKNIQQKNVSPQNTYNLIKIINKDCKSISLKDFGIENKIDMIYTDPPYKDQIPYLERHQLFNDWLKKFHSNSYTITEEDFKNEIVESNSPKRLEKNEDNYFNDIQKMFNASYDMLKKYGLMIMHLNLGIKKWLEVYNKFKNHARAAGFEPVFRYDIKNNNPTLRKQSAKANTSSMEIVLFFIRLTDKEKFWYINDINLDRKLYFVIKNYLKESDNLTQRTNDVEKKCKEYLKSHNFQMEARNSSKIHHIIDKYFIIDQGYVYTNDDMILFEDYTKEAVLSRIIDLTPVVIKTLLKKQGKFDKDDLFMNLSYKLDNGNKQAIDEIINNRIIMNKILNTLCVEKEDAYYPKNFTKELVKEGSNNKIIDIATLEGKEFEEVIASLLENEGYHEVFITPSTGDRGVDIYAKKNGSQYIYQVKRWVKKVGGTVIQRLHSMKENNNFDYAECITTSSYTSAAKAEAKECDVRITNGKQIIKRLNVAFAYENISYRHSLLDINN
jgi:HJR/Mrr/RecB family endonuclease